MHGGHLVGNGSRHGCRTAGGVCGSRWAIASLQRPRARHRVPSGADGSTIVCSVGLKMPRLCRFGALSAWLLCASALAHAASAPGDAPFELIIANGHVIDGTGSPWYTADVGIRDGHIAAIGRLANAQSKQRIDAAGYVVAPGFIDML